MQKENNKKEIKLCKYIYFIAIIGIFIDQITKYFIKYIFNLPCDNTCIKASCECLSELLITGGIYNGFSILPGKGLEIIKKFFYISYVKNTGGAWGLFNGNVLFLAFISLFVVVLLYFFLRDEKKLTKLSIFYYGFLFAGIIGNLVDRFLNGYVIDFLNFYIFGYDYPVFNIADILIVGGLFLMIVDVVRREIYAYKERKRKR